MTVSPLLRLLMLFYLVPPLTANPGAGPAPETPRLFRVIFDVELVHRDRRLTADLAVNKLAANLFSIKCRKVPGGTLFTYWATPAEDYLLFPKDDLAFVGDAGRPFELFPGGPELERDEWLKLLLEPTTGAAGPFRFLQDGSWRVLAHPDHGAMLRWREKKRIYTTRYKKKIFEPRRDPTVKKRPLHELTAYWEQHDFR